MQSAIIVLKTACIMHIVLMLMMLLNKIMDQRLRNFDSNFFIFMDSNSKFPKALG